MMPETSARPKRRPTVPYSLSYVAAMLGLMCVATAIDGARLARNGQDPLDAFSGAAVVALIACWMLLYYVRLIFWNRVSEEKQMLVRQSLRAFLSMEVLAAVLGTWFVYASGPAASDVRWLVIVGDILQIGTLLWIARYSSE